MVLLSKSRQKRVTLIQPPSNCVDDDRLEPNLGLMYIAAVLRQNKNLDVNIHDMSGCKSESEIDSIIENIPDADAYGISVVCSTHKYAARISKQIKNSRPDALVVAGGPNPTSLPVKTHEDFNLDSIVLGEGEDAFAEVISNKFSGKEIPKIKKGIGRINIDSYPFPARDLADMSTYTKTLINNPSIPMITSRGCPNKCIHCNSTIMGGGSDGARYRSINNILEEIKLLRPYTHLRFTDDNFTANPDVRELLKAIKSEGVTFRIFGRLDDLDNDLCKLLYEAGCVHIAVGMESLNPENLKVIGKSKLIGEHERVQIAKDNGLTIRASFMVGLPFDTAQNIEHYFKQAAKLPFDEFEVYPLIPFPGTQIALNPEKFGYTILDPDFTKYILIGKNRNTTFALEHNNFSMNQIMEWRKMAGDILKEYGKCYMKESKIAR
jgi:anaerobic magnesium-protoporphyrin IX monomethyl ester cyclase